MLPTRQGSLFLFRFSGIAVFLHWSWFIVALIEISSRRESYSSIAWNALEYLSLFAIVLMHEFGHSLACRQVGGQADQIVLWPLGGVAFVSPPQRPGATLWSIAAGPLVNLILVPLLSFAWYLAQQASWEAARPDAFQFIETIWIINLTLLLFNLLPVYPLDGGQILRSLLWFFLGRVRSLLVASGVGFLGVILLLALAVAVRSIWMGILAIFILVHCRNAWQQARAMQKLASAPARFGFACPACAAPPPVGELWMCQACQTRFDTFAHQARCPQCGHLYPMTSCAQCGQANPMALWADPQA